MVEQAAVNRKVEGSSPSLGANFLKCPKRARTREGRKLRRSFLREAVRSTSEADSACAASVSPSLGANFFQLFRDSINYLPEWRNWQTHRT